MTTDKNLRFLTNGLVLTKRKEILGTSGVQWTSAHYEFCQFIDGAA